MEEKIFNNLLHGYPFYFPFWREPLDEQCTFTEADLPLKIFKNYLDFSIVLKNKRRSFTKG
jgi:hypothetical protein